MLCQIEKCCRYAERTGRTLIVDTNYNNSTYWNDNFSSYFLSRQKRLLLSIEQTTESLEEMSVFPEFLQGRLNIYTTKWLKIPSRGFYDTNSHLPINFDMEKNYPHDLLVHHHPNGGTSSLQALLRIILREDLSRELEYRLRSIGGGYIGVHIRHTDYRTDYNELLNNLKTSSPRRLFLGTDSKAVLDHFRTELRDTEIFSFTKMLSNDGQPIHIKRESLNEAEIYERNRDVILDLLILALSSKLLFSKIHSNSMSLGPYSGFSLLAHNLWASKITLKHLLEKSNIRFGLE